VYRLLRPFLFALDPETSHTLTINALAVLSRSSPLLALIRSGSKVPQLPCEFLGLRFPNPIGLAAGLDKDARCFPALAALGFGHVELGTVTPKPQAGNPRKRLFRLEADHALINRMGFNSAGLDVFVRNVKTLRKRCHVPLGINLGKNAVTPLENAAADYVTGIETVYPLADYLTINISSPNTQGLRDLQDPMSLDRLLSQLVATRDRMAVQHDRRVPLLVKISPDLEETEIDSVAAALLARGADGVIATNTTLQRPPSLKSPASNENGGLSGRPLRPLATRVVSRLYQQMGSRIPVIGVGGVETAQDVWEKVAAGADLVQVYSAFIYHGGALVSSLGTGLAHRLAALHINDWGTAVQASRGTPLSAA